MTEVFTWNVGLFVRSVTMATGGWKLPAIVRTEKIKWFYELFVHAREVDISYITTLASCPLMVIFISSAD